MPFYWYHGLPDSVWNINNLEDTAIQRYHMYSESCVNLKYCAGDINTVDGIGHWFMCLLAVDVPDLKGMVIRGESKIFNQRLKCKSSQEIKSELSSVMEFLKNDGYSGLKKKDKEKLKLIQCTIATIYERIDHVFADSHKPECKRSKILLPFTFPLKLVANREVELKNGKVGVSCGKWKILLEIIFEYLLEIELSSMARCEQLNAAFHQSEDDRIRQLVRRCYRRISGTQTRECDVQKACEIDSESQFFPPCMANLHQVLRKKHRLAYETRYQYTLFLKDIGLPVEENLSFWKEEYQKTAEGSSCIHDWESKKERYKYQIRHLYGLIGSRLHKTSFPCWKFLEPLQLKIEGGCPFQHLSREALERSIPREIPDIEDILNAKTSEEPQKACAAYLISQQKALLGGKLEQFQEISEISSPLQYYFLAKNSTSRMKYEV